MYAKKAGMDLKGQNVLAEGRIRAERKAGKLLKGMDKVKAGRPKRADTMSALKSLGVSQKESTRDLLEWCGTMPRQVERSSRLLALQDPFEPCSSHY